MIVYNFDRILLARGITKPFAYLTKAGFSDQFASKVKNNRIRNLGLKEMEKLCTILHCTPNDFFEWIPDSNSPVDKNHPLSAIRRSDKVVDLTKMLNSVPLGDLDEIEELIAEKLKAKNSGKG